MKQVEYLAWCVNRRTAQEEFLFNLCDNDFDKLLELEAKMKKHFIHYCPGDKDEVEKLLKLAL